MPPFNRKVVTFAEDIHIRHYEYDKIEEFEEKRGRDWQRTTDLTCREFKVPLEKGGCGGDWNILQSKLDELEEPYWCLIGQLWSRLFPYLKRLEEASSDEDEDTDEDTEETEINDDEEEEYTDDEEEEYTGEAEYEE